MSNKLAGLRKMMGLTQVDMAKKIKTSPASYCNKENGNSDFKISEMRIITKLVQQKFPEETMDSIFMPKNF